jgi:hypothetical protein
VSQPASPARLACFVVIEAIIAVCDTKPADVSFRDLAKKTLHRVKNLPTFPP